MPIRKNDTQVSGRFSAGLWQGLAAMVLTCAAATSAGQSVTQMPLSIGTGAPGNLVLTPSVEWPTVNSVANLGEYSTANEFVGYFDPNKCYKYSYSDTESERHFYPSRAATTHTCSHASKEWSGNYLNWAATQTIDPFRKALTGGYRVKDTTTETWLEKARYDGNGGNEIFPNRRIPADNENYTLVQGATPADWGRFRIRIWKLGNKMRFSTSREELENDNADVVAYDPDDVTLDNDNEGTVYEVSVRVKVCTSALPEANCKQYGSNYKPEGLLQKYSEEIRYSVFGYLNHSTTSRDGGVLRAKQKYVGPTKLDPATRAWVDNTNKEWDSSTGVLVRNPDVADANATSNGVADSGVINYLNKFGQMTSQNHKSYDPVSELYYAALRYLRNEDNIAEYSNLTGGSTAANFAQADGFPVITDWDDPIQYRCQNNAILGIGDVNTHRDKNLPGNTSARNEEPTMPAAVAADANVVDAVAWTAKVAALENITINTPFTGRENSAYMAGLAYWAHTKDIRTDLSNDPKKQTVSTYWVDVREAETLLGRASNQYWLTAKYGGFTVPDDFNPDTHTTAFPNNWWTRGDTLTTTGGTPVTFPRPDNFYVASDASLMVESLTRAFAKIAADNKGSGSSLASNSTRLDTGTMVFQAQFTGGTWSGDLLGYRVNTSGALISPPLWKAADKLATAIPANRNIYVNANGSHLAFNMTNLTATQKSLLGSTTAEQTAVVNYLRGVRTDEEGEGGKLRTRTAVLGDIVNSAPIYVGAPRPSLYDGFSFPGATDYKTWAMTTAIAARTPVVYVGANDGMLHGFNASTAAPTGSDPDVRGTETYAFIPSTVIANGLKDYAAPNYQHKYFVDGELAVADVYDSTGSGTWKTILVGTLGRGGPGVYALDVTNPSAPVFLWEKNGTDIPALGKNIGKPVIAQVASGDWRVLIGNGPGSSTGSAQLVSINIKTGTATTIDTGATGSNGLTAVLARDTDSNAFADVAYAGDLKGNLWKFSNLGGTATVEKMFIARDPSNAVQPITAAPLAGKDPDTGITWVFFGTGKYLHETDLVDRQVQTWYGIKDNGVTDGLRASLIERSILVEDSVGNFKGRAIEIGDPSEMTSVRGWFMDLVKPPTPTAEGERIVVPNIFQGKALIGTTRIPDGSDVCKASGRGWIMAVNPFTGGRLDATFFDMNGDGLFNGLDMVIDDDGNANQSGTGDGDTKAEVNSGLGLDEGTNKPTFIEGYMEVNTDSGKVETIKTQGSAVDTRRMNWRELLN